MSSQSRKHWISEDIGSIRNVESFNNSETYSDWMWLTALKIIWINGIDNIDEQIKQMVSPTYRPPIAHGASGNVCMVAAILGQASAWRRRHGKDTVCAKNNEYQSIRYLYIVYAILIPMWSNPWPADTCRHIKVIKRETIGIQFNKWRKAFRGIRNLKKSLAATLFWCRTVSTAVEGTTSTYYQSVVMQHWLFAKVGPGARAKVGAAFGAGGLFGRDTFVIAEVRPVTITKVGTALHFSDPYLLIRGQTALVVAKVGPGARAKVGASFGAFCPLGSDTFVVAEVRPVTITKVGTALHFSDPYLLIRGQTALVVAKVGPGARAKVGASFGAFCPLGSDTFVVAEVRPVTITKVGTALHFSDPYLLIRGQTALVVAKVLPGARAKVGASFGALGPLGRATISHFQGISSHHRRSWSFLFCKSCDSSHLHRLWEPELPQPLWPVTHFMTSRHIKFIKKETIWIERQTEVLFQQTAQSCSRVKCLS